jgi:hypothetical protein
LLASKPYLLRHRGQDREVKMSRSRRRNPPCILTMLTDPRAEQTHLCSDLPSTLCIHAHGPQSRPPGDIILTTSPSVPQSIPGPDPNKALSQHGVHVHRHPDPPSSGQVESKVLTQGLRAGLAQGWQQGRGPSPKEGSQAIMASAGQAQDKAQGLEHRFCCRDGWVVDDRNMTTCAEGAGKAVYGSENVMRGRE